MKNWLFLLPIFSSSSLFAQANGQARQGNFMQTLIMIGIAILFFYFILWRPEKKRRKALETQRSSMKKGDRVTAMGLVGTLDKIEEKTVILKTVDGSKIEVVKAGITDVQSAEAPKVEEVEKP